MSSGKEQRFIQVLGISMAFTGFILYGPSIRSWWYFITNVLRGADVSLPLTGSIIYYLLPVFLLGKLSVGWAIFQLRFSARALAVGLLAIEAPLLLILSVPLILANHRGAQISGFLLLNLIVAGIDLASLILLFMPAIVRAFPEDLPKDWHNHQKRMVRFRTIRDSWQNMGIWNNTIFINLALLSVIFAPFTYFIASLYYLLIVFPSRPRSHKA